VPPSNCPDLALLVDVVVCNGTAVLIEILVHVAVVLLDGPLFTASTLEYNSGLGLVALDHLLEALAP
jgi:hypothetical protein